MAMKIVAVLNKELESGVAMNAAAHMALGLAARAGVEAPALAEAMIFQEYKDANGKLYPFISGLSLIVLRGKANDIRKFHAACEENKIMNTVFLKEMTGDTFREQLERLAATPTEAVGYYGVCAIADRDVLDPLTKRFSLWRTAIDAASPQT
jgi:hypothetical protein